MAEVKRYNPSIGEGLTNEQVLKRKEEKLVNYDTAVPTKSIKRIIFENLCTIFNLLNIIIGIAILLVGSYKNLLFLGIVFANIIISIAQEIHSKRMVDKLSIVSAIEVDVIRDGKNQKIKIDEIVLDDLIVFNSGNQVVTDCIVIDGEVEVNESFITGEPDNIAKQKGETILSGSFIVSGRCVAKVEHIGNDNYTSAISSGAKYVKQVNSEIMKSLLTVIRISSVIIIPLGTILLFNQLEIEGNTFQNAVVNTAGAVIGMIPEGLVLLISTVLAVSVIKLSKKKVLVQTLYCIETLARVDTLCLDKTGTITENKMNIEGIVEVNSSKEEIENILGVIGKYSEDINGTIDAIREKYKYEGEEKTINKRIPFTSLKKWSGMTVDGLGSYIIGSPEFVLKEKVKDYSEILNKYVNDSRILVLVKSKNEFEEKELPKEIEVMAFILINNKIREEAKDTLEYFKNQGVNIKIISGDNPITVSMIAKKVGVEDFNSYVDATTLITDEDIKLAAEKYTIFGRVTPPQKKALIKALKENGHTVAMTGDGVNDVLALKESDCGIAVASGSAAARNVAQLVLLDSNFDSMPSIVAEGRQTINNIQRSATLFLSKTIYATVLAFIFLYVNAPYPFIPIQLTIISVVTIGIPSFILALEPNKERVKGKFIINVIRRALPSALTVITSIVLIILAKNMFDLSNEVFTTICVVTTTVIGLTLLFELCRPFNIVRIILFVSMVLLFIFGVTCLRELLSLVVFDTTVLIYIASFAVIAIVTLIIYEIVVKAILKFIDTKKENKHRLISNK